eukprot:TRINITY_DN6117_c0_g1_i1.p1 TRINITY_DN6117_c0_g1~~TRINITY_DN6117_c0_g1_i1.p1  ORF type:complete len:308 (+),score=20.97 TRINITY_DN6117_c0_g1_i1:427-1350(+)
MGEWDEVDSSREMCCHGYDVANQILSLSYLSVLCYSLIILGTLPSKPRFTWEKLFNYNLSAACVVRVIFFFLQTFLRENALEIVNQVNMFMNMLPSFLIMFAYAVLVFFWAEMLYVTKVSQSDSVKDLSDPVHALQRRTFTYVNRLHKFYYTSFFVVLFGFFVLYILDFSLYPLDKNNVPNPYTHVEYGLIVWSGSLALCVAAGFSWYGFWMFKFALRSESRSMIFKIASITFLVVYAALFRAIIDFLVVFDPSSLFVSTWWMLLVFFSTCEVLPILLILNILQAKRQSSSSSHKSHKTSSTSDNTN